MSAGPSLLHIGGLIGGVVTFIGLIGSGIRWLVSRADTKEAALIKKLEARVADLEKKDGQRQAENIALRLAFEIVAGVVRRTDPTNPELVRAERILEQAFKVDLHTPADMLAALAKLS